MAQLTIHGSSNILDCPLLVKTGAKACAVGCSLGLISKSCLTIGVCNPGCIVTTGLSTTTCCALAIYQDYKKIGRNLKK